MAGPKGPHAQQLVAMRRLNTAACVEILRSHELCSVGRLAQRTGLSRPTIESILGELGVYGLVAAETALIPASSDVKGAGRPARLFRFQADAYVVASVDVGLHRIAGSLCDLRGTILASVTHEADQVLDAAARTASVHDLVRELLDRAHQSTARLHSVVVAVPGIVDSLGRMVLSNPLPDWTGVDLKARFEDGLPAGVRVIVENDINMAALAEHKLGAGRLADDMFYIHIGYRMNAALVLDGKLRRGHHYSTGEIGDMQESHWGASPIDKGPLAGPDDAPAEWDDASTLLADAASGKREARDAIERFAQRVAFTLAVTSAAVDPQLLVIGGGLSSAGEVLVQPLRHAVSQYFTARAMPEVAISTFGGRGTTFGGLVRALQDINSEIFHAPQLSTPTLSTP